MKTTTIYQTFKGSTLLAALLVMAGCSLAPTYHKPSDPLPGAYKETPPASANMLQRSESGVWKDAQPSEEIARGHWWTVYNDDILNELELQALAENQDLKAAVARLAEARALNQAARSALFPSIDAGIGATRQKLSSASQDLPQGAQVTPQTLYRAQIGISYEVDMFGRVASSVDASRADSERGEALFRSVQLTVAAAATVGKKPESNEAMLIVAFFATLLIYFDSLSLAVRRLK